MDSAPDPELLRRYAVDSDEAAFAELVRRYLNLVYFAAQRQAGGQHRAEDIAQIVFTRLARKAATLIGRQTLAGWLHRTTRFAANEAVRAEQRRLARETEAHLMEELLHDRASNADWAQLRPVIDEALSELGDTDREVVLLRYFANQSYAEVGARLSLSENSARMRVERALDKLQVQLAKRGVTSTSTAMAAALANQAVATAPAGLAASIVSSTLSGTVAAAGAGSAAAIFYFMNASKITLSVISAAALATGAAVYQINRANVAVEELAAAQIDRTALAQRQTTLERSAATAEQAVADREAALERARLATAGKLAAVARQAADDEERTKQQKALQLFLANDPELRRLRAEASRVTFRSGNHGLFLRSLGLTPEQIERVADLQVENREQRNTRIAAGMEAPPSETAESYYLPKMRAMFGDAIADRWQSYLNSWREVDVAGQLCASQFYKDEPFTAQQIQGVIDILAAARTSERLGDRFANYDWDRVLREAQPKLSPAQFESLRNVAAWGKTRVQLAEVAQIARNPDSK